MKRTFGEREGDETLQQKLFKAPDELDANDISSGVTSAYNFRGWWNAILAIPIDRYEQRAVVY